MDTDQTSTWEPLRPQLSRRRLENALRVLSRYYHFVSLEEAVDMLAGRCPLRPYSLVVTFDDGYRNNLTHALPTLRRHGVLATFFVTTGHINQQNPFWFDRLDYVLQYTSVNGREVQIGQDSIRLSATDRETLRSSYKQLRDMAKAVSRHDVEMLRELDDLTARLEVESGYRLADIFKNDDWSSIMTWEELRKDAGPDVIVGSHTVDHIRLGLVDDEMIVDQLRRSKEMIEMHTGLLCRYLAYPNGNFNERVAEIARACGYVSAVTTIRGTNRVGDDLMTLRRVGCPDAEGPEDILAETSGLAPALSQLRDRIRECVLFGRARCPHREDSFL